MAKSTFRLPSPHRESSLSLSSPVRPKTTGLSLKDSYRAACPVAANTSTASLDRTLSSRKQYSQRDTSPRVRRKETCVPPLRFGGRRSPPSCTSPLGFDGLNTAESSMFLKRGMDTESFLNACKSLYAAPDRGSLEELLENTKSATGSRESMTVKQRHTKLRRAFTAPQQLFVRTPAHQNVSLTASVFGKPVTLNPNGMNLSKKELTGMYASQALLTGDEEEKQQAAEMLVTKQFWDARQSVDAPLRWHAEEDEEDEFDSDASTNSEWSYFTEESDDHDQENVAHETRLSSANRAFTPYTPQHDASLSGATPHTAASDSLRISFDMNSSTRKPLNNTLRSQPSFNVKEKEQSKYHKCEAVEHMLEELAVLCEENTQQSIVPGQTTIFNKRAICLPGKTLPDALITHIANYFPAFDTILDIDLRGNQLTDKGGAIFVGALVKTAVHLRYLNFSRNKTGFLTCKAVCALLRCSSTLKELHIAGNALGDKAVTYLAQGVAVNGVLQKLDLSSNRITTAGGISLNNHLKLNKSLTNLNLSWNLIRGTGAAAIAKYLSLNLHLRTLNLAWNQFALEGAKALGEALGEDSMLVNLDLSYNGLTAGACKFLAIGLGQNSTLMTVRLSGNAIGSIGLKAMQTAMKSCSVDVHFEQASNDLLRHGSDAVFAGAIQDVQQQPLICIVLERQQVPAQAKLRVQSGSRSGSVSIAVKTQLNINSLE